MCVFVFEDCYPYTGLFAPILYGLMGYVASAIGCFIYNLAAKISGGVEFEMSDQA